MKWLKALVIAGLIVAIAIAGLLAWLFFTASGARFAMSSVSRFTAVDISASSTAGSLAGGLSLRQLSVALPQASVEAGVVRLSWSPAGLLRGRIAISTFAVRDLRVINRSPSKDEPLDLTWPRVSGLPLYLRAGIENLKVEDFSYGRPGEEPFLIDSIAGRIVWTDGRLALRDIAVKTPQAAVSGTATAGLRVPFLDSRLIVALSPEPAGRVHLQLHFKEAGGAGQLAGTVSAAGQVKGEPVWMEASVATFPHRIELRSLTAGPGEKAGRITMKGEVHLVQPATAFSGVAKIDGLDLAAFGKPSLVLSGELNASGTTEGYSGAFTVQNSAESWRAFAASGNFHGDAAHVNVEGLKTRWLGGTVTGETRVGWKDGVAGKAHLEMRGIDPELVDPTWKGNVNADLGLEFERTGGGEVRATAEAGLLESTFRGRPVTGVINGETERGEVIIRQLDLHGRGFDVTAKGVLSRKIFFDADVRDLSALLPGAGGSMAAAGWLRYRDSKATVAVNLEGRRVSYGDSSLASVHLSGELNQAQKEKIDLEVAARDVSFRQVDISRLTASASGRMPSHTIHLSVVSAQARVEAALSGGYKDGTWNGQLQRLRGEDMAKGNWTLLSPAGLSLSGRRIVVSPFRLAGPAGEGLSGRVNLALNPLDGTLHIGWDRLDVSRFNPLIPPTASGRSDGSLAGGWRKGSVTALSGEIVFSGRIEYRGTAFPVRESGLRLRWTEKGLDGSWHASMGQAGSLRGTMASSASPQFGLPEKLSLSTSWRDLRLALLDPFLGQDVRATGVTSGEAAGRLLPGKRFVVHLDVTARGGTVRLTTGGRPVSLPLRTLTVSADWREESLQGRLTVHAGQVGSIDARFTLPIPASTPLEAVPAGTVVLEAETAINDLAGFAPFLPARVKGIHGRARAHAGVAGTWERPAFNGTFSLVHGGAAISGTGIRLADISASGKAGWNAAGLKASVESKMDGRGTVAVTLRSSEGPAMKMPDTGQINADWRDIDLTLVSALMPEGVRTDGNISGRLTASLLPERRVSASIDTQLNDAQIGWTREGRGQVRVAVRTARMDVDWKGETMTGEGLVELARYGKVRTAFSLPLPARLPVGPTPAAPVQASVTGELREQGLVSSLLPGLVEETKGRLAFDVGVAGTWAEPVLRGNASLAGAGAYLPAAGIHIENISGSLELAGNTVRLVDLRAESGQGQVSATGQVRIAGWRIAGYEGKLTGERFQAAYLPELRLLVSPDLTIEGNTQRVSVRGDVRIPRLLIYGPPTENVVKESPDVIIMDARGKGGAKPPIQVDATLRAVLGDDVRVKMRGIDAKLGGSVLVRVAGMDDIGANGQINVVKGDYSAYGVELKVSRGQIVLAGPPERASLDILAVRQIEKASLEEESPAQVSTQPLRRTGPVTTGVPTAGSATSGEIRTGTLTVGVHVTGTVDNPVIELYSRPPLLDSEILSYVVLGKPLGGDVAQTGVLMQAAGALLSRGHSESFQDKLKRTLGLESLKISTTTQGGTESTMLSVGKYLSPGLYLSFGRSLFTDEYTVNIRYRLSKSWEIRTTTGGESGGDIYYKVEFD